MVRPWKAIVTDTKYQEMDPIKQMEVQNRWLGKVQAEKGWDAEKLSILKSKMNGGPDIELPQQQNQVGEITPPTSNVGLSEQELGTEPIGTSPEQMGLQEPSMGQKFLSAITMGMYPSEQQFAPDRSQQALQAPPDPVAEWALGTPKQEALNDIIGMGMDTGGNAPPEIYDSVKAMMGEDMTPSEIYERLQSETGAVQEPDFLPGLFSPENLVGGAGAGLKIAKGMGLPIARTVADEMSAGMWSIASGVRGGAKALIRGLRAGATERNIPVTKAKDIAQAVVEESIEIANKTLGGGRIPISLPARTATGGMLPEAGAGTVNPPAGLEQAQGQLRKFGKELGLPGHEQALLAKTGTLKPPNMVQAPYKGKAPIYQHEALSGMNERIRRGIGNKPWKRKVTGFLGEAQAEFETPIRMFEKMGGNAKKLIYDPIDDADVGAVREFIDRIKPMTKQWKKQANSKRIGQYLVGRQVGGEEVLKNMGKKVITIDELSGKERQVVSEMDAMYDELFGRINEARVASGLTPMKKVDNYHTFYRQLDYLSDKLGYSPFDVADYDKTIAKHYMHPDSTFFSSAMERKAGSRIPVELDAFQTFEKYTQSGLNHAYVSPEISRSRDLLKQIRKSHPENYRDASLWLDYVAGKVPEELFGGQYMKRLTNYLTRNVSMSVLSFNLRSAMIQPSALRNTLADVGPKYTLKGATKFMQQALDPKHRKFVHENSNLIARKYDASVEEIFKGFSGAKRKVATIGTKPLQIFDYWTANATWNSYFYKGTDALGMTEKEAIRYANDGVVRSQASGRRTHLTKMQRTGLGKALTGLQTFVINDWAFLTQDILGMGKNVPRTKENLKKVLYYIGGTMMTNSIYEDGLNVHSPFGTPVRATVDALKQDEGWYKALYAGSAQLMETVPMIGGSLRFGSTPLGPVAESVGKAFESASRKEVPMSEIGKWLGIPGVAQWGKTARRLDKGLSIPESVVGIKVEKPASGVPKPPKRKERKPPKRKRSR